MPPTTLKSSRRRRSQPRRSGARRPQVRFHSTSRSVCHLPPRSTQSQREPRARKGRDGTCHPALQFFCQTIMLTTSRHGDAAELRIERNKSHIKALAPGEKETRLRPHVKSADDEFQTLLDRASTQKMVHSTPRHDRVACHGEADLCRSSSSTASVTPKRTATLVTTTVLPRYSRSLAQRATSTPSPSRTCCRATAP